MTPSANGRARPRRHLCAEGERGATVVLVAIAIVAMLGVTALAIDVGMLLNARTEAQRTADAAAMAGAGEWHTSANDHDATRTTAQNIGALNPIVQDPPVILDEDVEIIPAEDKVRVTVYRTQDRGTAVPTYFARVLGFDEVDISAIAAARIAGATVGGCPLPLALIDEWIDVDDDDMWDEDIDQYVPYPEPGYTGYSDEDIGMLIEIKDASEEGEKPPICADTDTYEPCKAFGDASWDCWWLEEHPSEGGGGGTDELGPRILSCVIDGLEIGDTIWSASGAGSKQELITDEFKSLVDSDPDVVWDDSQNCPARDGQCTMDSDRIRSVPLVDPRTIEPDGGANTKAIISNWAGVFIEKVTCSANLNHGEGPEGHWNVYARLTGMMGAGSGGRPGSLLTSIQLVE